MKVQEIEKLLEANVILKSNEFYMEEITNAVAADLMSEIMIDTMDGSLLVTGLVNPQVIRTAEMMNVHTIMLVRGKKFTPSMLELAEERDMNILETKKTMFEACGILYQNGIKGGR